MHAGTGQAEAAGASWSEKYMYFFDRKALRGRQASARMAGIQRGHESSCGQINPDTASVDRRDE